MHRQAAGESTAMSTPRTREASAAPIDEATTGTVQFGSETPWAEPSWYDARNDSPYYGEPHRRWRARMRKYVDECIVPNVDAWEAAGEVPLSAYKQAADAGVLAALSGWPEGLCGPRPDGYDGFFILIAHDEISRCASGGVVWGLIGGLGIGLPPVVFAQGDNKDWLHREVAAKCLDGSKRICLAVSEPTAGSDVAGLRATAVLSEDGTRYVVNGMKKWITNGMFADFFTVAVRTGGEGSGMLGVELLLVERTRAGVRTRPMDCMGVKGSGTAFVEFNDVVVPARNLIGGVHSLLRNFVTERLGLAIQACRFSRVCLQESVEYARWRRAFGKKLEDQPVVRHKIAEMARKVISTHALIESLAGRLVAVERRGDDWYDALLRMGAEAALCKVQATKCFDFCATCAAHLQGGNAYVKGNKIESLYRHVLSLAIPGGSEDVLIDAAARLALKGRL
jgi:alkylation response protein AidB-like acyl-CoA dehydrogenase